MIDILLWAGVFLYISAFLLNIPRFIRSFKQVRGSFLWVSLAWVLMFFGLAVFVVRTHIVATFGDVDSSAIYQIIFFGIALLIILALMIVRLNASMKFFFKMPVLMMALYGLLGVISMIYSPAPWLSAYKGVLILMDVLLVLVALAFISSVRAEDNRRVLLQLSYFLLSLMIFGAVLGGVIFPAHSRHPISGIFGYQLYGLWPALNPNELGFICAITGIVALRRFFEQTTAVEKYFWFSQIFISVTVLIVAQARTSVISFALAILMLSFLIRKLRWAGIVIVLMVFVAGTYAVLTGERLGVVEVVEQYSERGLSEKNLQTMTGRTELWKAGLAMFYDSPVFGQGYDAGVRIKGPEYGIISGTHMHSAHFQVLANSGFLGYIAWFLMLISVSWKVFRPILRTRWPILQEANRFHAETAAVLMVILLRTLTGQVLVTHQYSLLIFMAIIIYIFSAGAQTKKSAETPASEATSKC